MSSLPPERRERRESHPRHERWAPALLRTAASESSAATGRVVCAAALFQLTLLFVCSFPVFTWTGVAELIEREVYEFLLIAGSCCWWAFVALYFVGSSLSSRDKSPLLYAYAVTLLFTGTFLMFGVAVGTLSVASGTFTVGAAMVGFLLFERRIIFTSLALNLLVMVAATAAAVYGRMPYAPLLRVDPIQREVVSGPWSLIVLFMVLPSLGLALWMTLTLLANWKAREARITELSERDALTGVFNRRRVMEKLADELARAARYGHGLSVLMIDLDHFKRVNDTHGHLAGDLVLAEVARALLATVRDVDLVGRYGGEEFIVGLPETSLSEAAEVAERCRCAIAAASAPVGDGQSVAVTASLGVVEASVDEGDRDKLRDLVARADRALYVAKDAGRDRVELGE